MFVFFDFIAGLRFTEFSRFSGLHFSAEFVNLPVVNGSVQDAVSSKVENCALPFAWSVPRASADHLLPETPTECMAIQNHKVHIRHVNAFGEYRVIA